ncbi:MAG: arginine--tRNA ligase [Cytophagales bacterium]|nr:arginine--tRNA ligase [Cytophagales bacterium]
MDLQANIKKSIVIAFKEVYQVDLEEKAIVLQPTRKEFEGTYTLVTFPFAGRLRQSPEAVANAIGEYLKESSSEIADFNVLKGFLNLVIADNIWVEVFNNILNTENYGQNETNDKTVMVEYSSPNTNKPLHLGHLRNNFLGYSLAEILKAGGYKVVKANLVNDRGIHICKSMLAYQKWGNNETPSESLKGDHLIGKYYVEFDKNYKVEIEALVDEQKVNYPAIAATTSVKELKDALKKKKDLTDDEKKQIETIKEIYTYAEKNAPSFLEAQEMLRKWEAGDEKTVALWKQLNNWVYDGFNHTYKLIGVDFDQFYYESDTYLLGKDIVNEGLEKNTFYKKEDDSVWADLSNTKLDDKLVLRGDGTSVYITQDMGTADLKYKDYSVDKSIYVVGNEQDHHFKVLKTILGNLERPYADGIYHMSYGMVELPNGKMKSREGTVVDADDLVGGMIDIAKERTDEQGKIDGFTEDQAQELYKMLALGALKYFILKVDPKNTILFDPEESIEFQGNTGPFIQYNHARICSLMRKADEMGVSYTKDVSLSNLETLEVELISLMSTFPDVIKDAGEKYAPSIIAQYAYDLARTYSRFFNECPIFKNDSEEVIQFRLTLSYGVGKVIEKAMKLLGIGVPERM